MKTMLCACGNTYKVRAGDSFTSSCGRCGRPDAGGVVDLFDAKAKADKDLLDYAAATQRLCVSKRTVEYLVQKGELKVVKIGRRTLFDPAEINRFKNAHTERARG